MGKITKNGFRNALKGSLGIITTIAQRLEVTRLTVYKFLAKHPELREEMETEKDKILDKAESVLFKKVNDEEWKAIEFTLTKLGHKRGYADKKINEHQVETPIWETFKEAYEDSQRDSEE